VTDWAAERKSNERARSLVYKLSVAGTCPKCGRPGKFAKGQWLHYVKIKPFNTVFSKMRFTKRVVCEAVPR